MAKLQVLSLEGKELREFELNDEVFGIEPNQQVLFDAVQRQMNAVRQGNASTKTRAEVRGGGRKPWRQKGTGRARQGSIRAPQWKGGGRVFGPSPRSYATKLNRKVRQLALRSALSQKALDNHVKVIENLHFEEIKTKEFLKVMQALELGKKTLFVYDVEEDIDNAYLSLRNVPSIALLSVEGLNVLDILHANKMVFTEQAAKKANEVFA